MSSLPTASVNEEFITDFFENKKNGGGDVVNVSYNQRNNTAIVTFEDFAGKIFMLSFILAHMISISFTVFYQMRKYSCSLT